MHVLTGRSRADGCTLTLTQQTDGGGDVVSRVYTESFAAQSLPRLHDTWAEVTESGDLLRISKHFKLREEAR